MLFEEKIKLAKGLFEGIFSEFECFKSPLNAYRTRAEFGFYKDEGGLFYAMFDPKTKKKFIIEDFELAVLPIQAMMKSLLSELNLRLTLTYKLFGAEFLATKNDLSVSLLYHTDINALSLELNDLSQKLNLKLIARSKGKKLVFKGESLLQSLEIQGKTWLYELNNDCFIQPNTAINEIMIKWLLDKLATQTKNDLLEPYCGYGNFTLPLSLMFRKVLATELSKTNINFALKNASLNKIQNVNFARLSSKELMKALRGEREFYRLKELDLRDFNFSHIFVDPPRAGLEEELLSFVAEFSNIIYISCSPQTLKRDLTVLLKTHKILNFALFDQFAKTPHLECGVILSKI